jgi:hypothetical protein
MRGIPIKMFPRAFLAAVLHRAGARPDLAQYFQTFILPSKQQFLGFTLA